MIEVSDAIHKRLDELLLAEKAYDADHNIVGFGFGKKIRAGMRLPLDALTVFVKRKLPRSELQRKPNQLPIKRAARLHHNMSVEDVFDFANYTDETPPRDEEVWTDIVERPYPLRLQAYQGHHKGELIGGISIGLESETTGTLGYFVRNKTGSASRPGREFYLLTAGHVLNKTLSSPPTTRVCQPGDADCKPLGLTPNNCYLADVVETTPLYFAAGTPGRSEIDAGIARPISAGQAGIVSAGHCNPDIIRIRIMECGAVTGIAAPEENMLVKKVGRTSGLTWGKITHPKSSFDLVNPHNHQERTTLSMQIITTAMSREGDSGALLLDEENHAVGLLCAGCEDQSVFTPIDVVLDKLKVELF